MTIRIALRGIPITMDMASREFIRPYSIGVSSLPMVIWKI
jgi:hypothetical protein